MTLYTRIDTLLKAWCLLQNTHCQHQSKPIANSVTSPSTCTTKKHHRAPHSTHGGNPGPWTWAKWLHQGDMVGICRQSKYYNYQCVSPCNQGRVVYAACAFIRNLFTMTSSWKNIFSVQVMFRALYRIPYQYSWHNSGLLRYSLTHPLFDHKLSGVWMLSRALHVLLYKIQMCCKLLAHTCI